MPLPLGLLNLFLQTWQPFSQGQLEVTTDDDMATCARMWKGATENFPGLQADFFPTNLRGDPFLQQHETPTVLFVHVGKSCGGTLTTALHDTRNEGVIRRSRPCCPPSAEVHVHPVREEVLDHADNVLIALRDPLERAISAYNEGACLHQGFGNTCIRHMAAAISTRANPESNRTRLSLEHLTEFKLVLDCFPNVTAFADGLEDKTKCGRLARDLIAGRGEAPIWHGGHFSMGPCFYLGGLLDKLKTKHIKLVQTESCDADMRAIPAWLGQSGNFEVPPPTHVGEYPHHRDRPSDEGLRRMRRYLAHEYALYDALRHLSEA